MLVAAAGAHPAFDANLAADEGGVEDIADFRSFHLYGVLISNCKIS